MPKEKKENMWHGRGKCCGFRFESDKETTKNETIVLKNDRLKKILFLKNGRFKKKAKKSDFCSKLVFLISRVTPGT